MMDNPDLTTHYLHTEHQPGQDLSTKSDELRSAILLTMAGFLST